MEPEMHPRAGRQLAPDIAPRPDGLTDAEWKAHPIFKNNTRRMLHDCVDSMDIKGLSEWLEALGPDGLRELNKPDGSHFETFEEFAKFKRDWGLGNPPEIVYEIWEAVHGTQTRNDHGGDHRSESYQTKHNNDIMFETQGTSRGYLASRLAKHHPGTWDAFKAGEYMSVHAAAKAAGIAPERSKRDPYLAQDTHKAAQRLIATFGPDWCRDLHRALGEQLDG